MATAQSIIERAMRSISVTGQGKSPSSAELADGLTALNDLLDSWSSNSMLVPYRTIDSALAISTSKNEYTIGSGGDFNTGKPIRIDAITIYNGDIPYPVREMDVDTYRRKLVNAEVVPEFFYYNPGLTTGSIFFSSKPSTTHTVTIDSLKEFTQFSTLATDINFPPGYVRALRFNLAIDLASEYGRNPPPSVLAGASEGRDFIETQAMRLRPMNTELDNALLLSNRSSYNVTSDQ